MSDTDTFSVSQLIELVRQRPVLWDRQEDVYKNRKLTKKAWAEICEALIENYDDLGDQQQRSIGRSVIGKWANLRDNWLRYWRKRQQLLLSGSTTSSLKKYIHHDQLLFLSKVYDPEGQQEVEEIQVDVDVISDPEMEPSPGLSFDETSQNMWSFQEEESKPSDTDHHIYFFHSVLPLIKDFDNEQTIDFQMTVFECIKRIRVTAAMNNQFYNPSIDFQNQEQSANKMDMFGTQCRYLHTQEYLPQRLEETSIEKLNKNNETYSRLETDQDVNEQILSSCGQVIEKSKIELEPSLNLSTEKSSTTTNNFANLNKAISKLEKISKKISKYSLEDNYDHFGRYVVSLLRKLSPNKVQFIKRKLIIFITNHFNSSAKKNNIVSPKETCQRIDDDSKLNVRDYSVDGNDSHNEINVLDKDLTDESHQECTLHNSSDEPTLIHCSSSSHQARFLVKNMPATILSESLTSGFNQQTYKKKRRF